MAAPINNQLPLPVNTGAARQERKNPSEGDTTLRVGNDRDAAPAQQSTGDTVQLSETARRLSTGEITERPMAQEEAYALAAKLRTQMMADPAQALAAQASRAAPQLANLLQAS